MLLAPLEESYSNADDFISELGADDAANPNIMNAAIVLLGLAGLALAFSLLKTLPRRRAAYVTVALFAGFGVAFVVAGLFNVDCSTAGNAACQRRWDTQKGLSTAQDVHGWAAFLAQLLFLATPFALARALQSRPGAPLARTMGRIGLAVLFISTLAYTAGGADGTNGAGLVQRFGFAFIHTWTFIVAAGVLRAVRPAPAESDRRAHQRADPGGHGHRKGSP